jgi:ring-1,2-phenylacetyl-CoA epoxidase subunit PaaD
MVKRTLPSRDEVLQILDGVKDPEVPVISVVELGIVRDVVVLDDDVTVTITPTYSGCPAMREIESEIRAALLAEGFARVNVRTTHTPAWTTEWIGAEARAKLEAYGIAAPGPVDESPGLVTLHRRIAAIECPYCKSRNTERKSEFGSTACKAIWYCNGCRQPFEEFKAF